MRSQQDAKELVLLGALDEKQKFFPLVNYPKDADSVFVASYEGRVVGGIKYLYLDDSVCWISEIFVHPNHRWYNKVGRRLLRAVEEVAVREGKKEIALNTLLNLKGFYVKCGFNVISGESEQGLYKMGKILTQVEEGR